MYTKGSENIYFIDLNTHLINTKNIKKFLKDAEKNIILDIQKYNSNIYLLQLKSMKISNFKIIDIINLKELKINNKMQVNRVFRSSDIVADNSIIITGGKISYCEKSEYGFYDSQKPYAKEQYKVSSAGYIIKNSMKVKINR